MNYVPLRELCSFRHGGTPSKANASFWQGSIPWVSPKDMKRALIAEHLRVWADSELCDVILTTGGTGLTKRDVTPEATRDVAERDVPGIAYALVANGLQHTPYAALTRGIAVTRGAVLIVNLPGSPKAVAQGMDVVLPLLGHVAELLQGPVEHAQENR